jgi:hypothetical protein
MIADVARKKKDPIMDAVFNVKANVRWAAIEKLIKRLGGTVQQREGSRVAFILEDCVAVFHRPHPSPYASKGRVRDVREFLKRTGLAP